MKITSEIPGTIRYTTDGNEPDETSQAYTDVLQIPEGCTLKARVYWDNPEFMDPSDIESVELPVQPSGIISVGDVLPDGSIIAYDRGDEYGNYGYFQGYPIRISSGVDDGTTSSENWRYLILENINNSSELYYTTSSDSDTYMGTESTLGAGIDNTEKLLDLHSYHNDTFVSWYVKNRREQTSFNWFIMSLYEARAIQDETIKEMYYKPGHYWTSTEQSGDRMHLWVIRGGYSQSNKYSKINTILCRRV